MKIIKDSRKWVVTHEFMNIDCPYLFYPANYHGCQLSQNGEGYCTLENCPSPNHPVEPTASKGDLESLDLVKRGLRNEFVDG